MRLVVKRIHTKNNNSHEESIKNYWHFPWFNYYCRSYSSVHCSVVRFYTCKTYTYSQKFCS